MGHSSSGLGAYCSPFLTSSVTKYIYYLLQFI